MRLRQSPIAVLLLVPVGVLAGHAVGYVGAGHVHAGAGATAGHSHGYLTVAAGVAALLAVLALAGAAAGVNRTVPISFRGLVALQWGVLLVQEAVEHALAGEPAVTLVTAPALWLSLAGQMAAAAGAALLVRGATVVGARLASLPASEVCPLLLPCRGPAGCGVDRLRSSPMAWTAPARGPPALPA